MPLLTLGTHARGLLSCVYLSVRLLPLQLLQRAFNMEPTIVTCFSYDLYVWSFEKPICILAFHAITFVRAHREPFSRTFGTNGALQLPEAQLVGRMLLQRLPTGATGVKQAGYTHY